MTDCKHVCDIAKIRESIVKMETKLEILDEIRKDIKYQIIPDNAATKVKIGFIGMLGGCISAIPSLVYVVNKLPFK